MSRWAPPTKTKTVRAVRGAPPLTAKKALERRQRGPHAQILAFLRAEMERSTLPYPKARSHAIKAAAEKFDALDIRSIQRLWKEVPTGEPLFLATQSLDRQAQQNKTLMLRFADRLNAEQQRLLQITEKVTTRK